MHLSSCRSGVKPAAAFVSVVLISCSVSGGAERSIDYSRDIQPILSGACYACHGPDEGQRKADLRLDSREGALADLDGVFPIVPGNREDSELYARITADSKRRRMPPAKTGKTLTPEQIELIGRWIDQGAPFNEHWAYVPVTRPAVPAAGQGSWSRSAIDDFILARLEAESLSPSPEADRRTLLRRLSFDLIGLPPTPEDVEAFQKDDGVDAYRRVVDRLLASQHYGERMAMYWLDVVRFADTNGIHGDNHRDVYLYRDYVIDAFNENVPFDRFTVEQLAGDLVPGATLRTRVASGFNRLNMTTREGGAQPKEYLTKYSADRVRNTAAAWLGTSMGCAECHNHKYDPFTMRDFYSFAAFFADLKETAVGIQEGTPIPSPKQAAALASLEKRIAALRKTLNTQTPELDAAQEQWEQDLAKRESLWRVLTPDEAAAPKGTTLEVEPDGTIGATGQSPPSDAYTITMKIREILALAPERRSDAQGSELSAHYRAISPILEPVREKLAALEAEKKAVQETIPTTLVSMSAEPRTIRILPRGNWLDESGEVVLPATPAHFPGVNSGQQRATRLDLARWMVDERNPLVARVFVNRLWKLFFGRGIVTTLDDFGTQGDWPSHPELLDWLAAEFVDSGWDVKHMIRLMVSSSTYRQTSRASKTLRERDPANRLFARQSRFRLDAELVRDNALAISGLLVPKVGGRSAKPYQPVGYWKHLNFPKRVYEADAGENQYRRGLYSYWCRTFLHPSLLAFDAPTREECAVNRPRSNTPLQALVLLNDPTYVEAARVFATRMLREAGPTVADQIRFAFREALNRAPSSDESRLLADLYEKHHRQYREDRQAADAVLGVGQSPVPDGVDRDALAAATSVARVVFNLHETLTRY